MTFTVEQRKKAIADCLLRMKGRVREYMDSQVKERQDPFMDVVRELNTYAGLFNELCETEGISREQAKHSKLDASPVIEKMRSALMKKEEGRQALHNVAAARSRVQNVPENPVRRELPALDRSKKCLRVIHRK